jgi:hypothetical protein
MTADSNYVVKLPVTNIKHGFAPLIRNIDTDFPHNLYSKRIKSVFFYACRVGIDPVSLKVPAKSFSHLAAARVSRA